MRKSWLSARAQALEVEVEVEGDGEAKVAAGRTGGGAAPSHAPATQPPGLPSWLHRGQPAPGADIAAAEWERLARGDPNAGVYFLPSMVMQPQPVDSGPIVYAHWKHNGGGSQLDSMAVLPSWRMRIPVLPPLGWNISLRGRRVLENCLLGDNSPEAIENFVAALAELVESGQTDCVLFQDLETHVPLRDALARAAQQRGLALCSPSRPVPRWWIRFPARPADYWSQFSKKTRYNFRYRAKHLEHTVRRITSAADIPAFIDAVQAVEQRTWQTRRLGRVTDARQKLAFWDQLATLGALRSYLLEQAGKPLAFAIGFQWKGRYVYVETGYDPDFAAKSPGQVLLWRMLEDLIERDCPELMDFGYGDGEYKRIFGNHQTLSGPVVLSRRTLWPVAGLRWAQARSAMGRSMRQSLSRLRILPLLRHLQRGTALYFACDTLTDMLL